MTGGWQSGSAVALQWFSTIQKRELGETVAAECLELGSELALQRGGGARMDRTIWVIVKISQLSWALEHVHNPRVRMWREEEQERQ